MTVKLTEAGRVALLHCIGVDGRSDQFTGNIEIAHTGRGIHR